MAKDFDLSLLRRKDYFFPDNERPDFDALKCGDEKTILLEDPKTGQLKFVGFTVREIEEVNTYRIIKGSVIGYPEDDYHEIEIGLRPEKAKDWVFIVPSTTPL